VRPIWHRQCKFHTDISIIFAACPVLSPHGCWSAFCFARGLLLATRSLA
jgi:hypothetical protein